ncbi:hypothetical protein C8Q75DRAFT_406718 [Abortiporus biennis]|nr:hypothetical protein C8Q75DRAFT_406718 [Abortiporus biennis]
MMSHIDLGAFQLSLFEFSFSTNFCFCFCSFVQFLKSHSNLSFFLSFFSFLLGSKFSPPELTTLFNTNLNTFKYPEERKLKIEGCISKDELSNLASSSSSSSTTTTTPSFSSTKGLIIGKDGNTTNLTIRIYAGLVSFFENEEGTESIELGIYNSSSPSSHTNSSSNKRGVEAFCEKGEFWFSHLVYPQ